MSINPEPTDELYVGQCLICGKDEILPYGIYIEEVRFVGICSEKCLSVFKRIARKKLGTELWRRLGGEEKETRNGDEL